VADIIDLITPKLDRADEHIKALKEMFDSYFDNDVDHSSATLQRKEGAGEGELLYNNLARVSEMAKQAVIIGEVVHNMRSALDHLASELVKANGGVPVKGGRGTVFPILEIGPTPNRHGRCQPPNIRGGVDAAAATIIGAVQPYRHPSGDPQMEPLMILNNLWNEDKHRSLLVSPLTVGDVSYTGTSYPVIPVPGEMRIIAKNKSFAELIFVPDDASVDVDCRILLNIALPPDASGFHTAIPVIEGLEEIMERVRDVVAQLTGFLPSHDAPPER
jgi:hypothetical protein